MMSKMQKFNKFLYAFIFSVLSMFVFVLEFKTYNSIYTASDSAVVNFFIEFYRSLKSFDIVYVTLWIFILYFYFNVYFNDIKYSKKSFIYTVIAIIFSLITIMGKSYGIDNTLKTIYENSVQIFKTILLFFGYYLIYYAILKKLFNFKLEKEDVKKKHHF